MNRRRFKGRRRQNSQIQTISQATRLAKSVAYNLAVGGGDSERVQCEDVHSNYEPKFEGDDHQSLRDLVPPESKVEVPEVPNASTTASTLDELQKIGVDGIGFCRGHAVRKTLVGL